MTQNLLLFAGPPRRHAAFALASPVEFNVKKQYLKIDINLSDIHWLHNKDKKQISQSCRVEGVHAGGELAGRAFTNTNLL